MKKRTWLKIAQMGMMLVLCLTLGMAFSQSRVQAKGKYLIKINKQQNCVTIYKVNASGKYKPVKALICSTGYATKAGTYSMGQKMRWHTLDGPCYGQYCARIYGGVLFHSVWYTGKNDPATLSISAYNKLGTTASHGCVRLTVEGAKWIYDNVPSGTKIIIYSAKDPGPLGKPKAIKLPNSYRWDPTDIGNAKNPWNSKKPTITGAKNATVEYGQKFNVMKGITAKNTTGFDAKSLVKVVITYNGKKVAKVDTKKPGKYKVKYVLKDEIGRKATAKITVKVSAIKATPKISNAKDLYVTAKSVLTKKYLLKNITVKQAGKKISKKYVTVKLKKVKTNVYKVTYTAQKASMPAKVTVKAYVDKVAPVISGITNGKTYRISKTDTVNKTYARKLIKKVTDNYTKLSVSKVAVTISKTKDGKYKVVYGVADKAGNQTKVTIYLLPTEFVSITAPSALTVKGTDIHCDSTSGAAQIKDALTVYLLSNAGISAKTYDGKDITSQIELTLKENSELKYTAKFFVTDKNGHQASKTVKVEVEISQ